MARALLILVTISVYVLNPVQVWASCYYLYAKTEAQIRAEVMKARAKGKTPGPVPSYRGNAQSVVGAYNSKQLCEQAVSKNVYFDKCESQPDQICSREKHLNTIEPGAFHPVSAHEFKL